MHTIVQEWDRRLYFLQIFYLFSTRAHHKLANENLRC